ncbi:hypothetical protein [uncultured Aeromicrobium sp.]|uniref:hypothetical protein n=1 Tax=uncultured Aeromicrobium sp. TaxID=337820 RepID=UPI0025D2924D|nr:hypothetical protein [uncultured Aeromicrobium sp.]
MNCLHCTAPTAGTTLCNACRTTLKVALDNIASYHGELLSIGNSATPIRARRAGHADSVLTAITSDNAPRPDDPDMAAAETKNLITTWARIILEENPPATYPADTVRALVGFLIRHLRTIATADWADQITTDMLTLERRIRRIVERGRGRWYAGICSAILRAERPHDGLSCACACHNAVGTPCDIEGGCGLEYDTVDGEICERDLYAIPGYSYVRCPDCKTQHSVAARRATLLAEARETLLPLSVISTVCVTLLEDEPSVERLLKRLRKWAERGDLIWADHDGGTRLYRVGDVLDLLARRAADPRGWSRRARAC